MEELKHALKTLKIKEDDETIDLILNLATDIANYIDEYAREMDEEGVRLENGEVIIPKAASEANKLMMENGLFGMLVPEKYDGAGASFPLYTAVFEILSAASAGATLVYSLTGSVVEFLVENATDEAKEKFLPMFAKGEAMGGITLTEPQAGSDLGSVKTRIERDGDEYIINGEKIFISNAGISNIYIVLGSQDPSKGRKGLTALVFDVNEVEGFTVERLEKKMGLKASPTGVVRYNNVRVPKENLLGKEFEGYKLFLKLLTGSRIGIAAQAVGIANAAYKKALAYAKERKQFGKKLSEIQTIQNMIARMKMRIISSRASYLLAASLKDQGLPYSTQAASAKIYCAEAAQEVTSDALQIFGGYGYIKEYDVERYYRDARVTAIYEGTTQIQQLIIAKNELSGRNI